MKIKLTGELHPELKAIGCKAGDIVEAFSPSENSTGVLHFTVKQNNCSVWPENYEVWSKHQNQQAESRLSKDEARNMVNDIQEVGFEQAMIYFGEYIEITSRKFHELRQAYKDARSSLQNFIESCAEFEDKK